MSYHSRRILPPGSSRKRKEREPFYYSSLKPSSNPVRPEPILPKPVEPLPNRILAGYMAHEFLTKGTLLGQKFDPARAEAVPVGAEPKRPVGAEPVKREHHSYADVAAVLKSDGAHIPGVVNPTQLARWIHM